MWESAGTFTAPSCASGEVFVNDNDNKKKNTNVKITTY